jgi:hypothetical protein
LDVQTNMRGGMGPPVTYQLDGKQYVAFLGGTGSLGGNRGAAPPPPAGAAPAGGAPAAGRGATDSPDVANAAAAQRGGGAGAAPPAPAAGGPPGFTPGPSPKLLVFMLDGKAELPK